MTDLVFRKIAKEVLNRNFIKRYGIERKRVSDYVTTMAFKEKIRDMLDRKDYTSQSVYALMQGLIENYPVKEQPEDWLTYIYFYSLNFSFPAAVTIELNYDLNRVAELYLRVLRIFSELQMTSEDGTWQSRYPLSLLTESEIEDLEDRTEFDVFRKAFKYEFVYEMMKLNQEVIGYTTLDHICGVHYIAMKIARQLKALGFPIDLGRVSGAAAGHDIGKFGCKPEEAHKVAYYHYYYTGEWFEKRSIVYIRNVAINHSTWDLELEALPIESLILIYSDFRVKADYIDGVSQMKIFTLEDSFNVILNKLDNLDEAKENRYRRVYSKLNDFENFLLDLNVNTDADRGIDLDHTATIKRKYFALMQGDAITQNVVFSSIQHNIELLYRFRDEASLNKLLEPVRTSRDMTSLRGYIAILEEYYNYLTQKQKQIVIGFLYEKLVLPQEDIRKQCAELIGTIIASYDEEIRKEIPTSALVTREQLDTVGLFNYYVDRFLNPETKVIERHKKYISYSMRDMIASYFQHLKGQNKRLNSIEILVNDFEKYREEEKIRFYLIKAARVLPFDDFSDDQRFKIMNFVSELLTNADVKLRLRAYNLIYSILPYADEDIIVKTELKRVVSISNPSTGDPAENYARLKLAETLRMDAETVDYLKQICIDDLKLTSNIFLSNLKSATLDVAKRFQIELLMRNTLLYDYENSFYMAMHLCNLLKVSALESVRNTAGRMLLHLVSHLNFEQKNDIAVELIRALEMESYEFTKYIPPYLGQIILHVHPKELDEIIESFEKKMSTNNEKLIALIVKTVGYAVVRYSNYKYAFKESVIWHEKRILRMYGVLFNGFVHSSSYVNQMAFSVVAKDIFSEPTLSLKKKEYLYRLTIKKTMSLMVNTDEANDLIFFNNSASLKYIYNFISEYQHLRGTIPLKPNTKIAFFPGAFDPFTLSHKQIANDIKKRGFEVLLYVDEFSWSKRTQPNLIRRTIIKRSVADEIGIFPFPRDVTINIANDKDLKRLKKLFPDSEVYLVVGTDVILNASAYKGEMGFIKEIPHLIYERGGRDMSKEDQKRLNQKIEKLHPNTLKFTLPKAYETISSTLIRDYIDENRDISTLIDPLAQNFIYEKSLYQREPLLKELMTTKSISLEFLDQITDADKNSILMSDFKCATAIIREIERNDQRKLLVLRSLKENGKIIAISMFHWLRAADIHYAFDSPEIIKNVRDHSVGRILMIDGIFKQKGCDFKNVEQIMLTETLANALSRDYTYCVYKESLHDQISKEMDDVLRKQGFVNISSTSGMEIAYSVNMSTPCTLNLDVHSQFKEPYKSMPELNEVMVRARGRLQKALTELYPGNLVLNFDRAMIYETLIKKVCDENGVSVNPVTPRTLGTAMCVPFGAVFKRWILPNTVTKTLHAEKYFSTDLATHQIREYPYYLDLENQIKMIKSYDRPIILVDDLLNKGYRLQALVPYFEKYKVNVQKFIVGIMSGAGREVAESMNLNVGAAYFIPKIKVWFYESKLYPFIDGDAIWRGSVPDRNLINSVNLILPYSSAGYITDTSKAAIYNLSEVALVNTVEILSAVEMIYEKQNERMLTIDRLGEVLNTPRYPDKGKNIFYSSNVRPSEYIKDDLEQLRKMKNFYIG